VREWGVHIPRPDKTCRGNRLNGFFAHLEHDLKTRQMNLRLLLGVRRPNCDEAVAIPIHMGMGGMQALV
jgi:hypothetical protein